MYSLSPLERQCYWTLANLHNNNELLQKNADYISKENIYCDLNKIFTQGALDRKPTEILHLEKFAINAEYVHIENDSNIEPKLKASRIKILDEALIQIRNCLKDVELIINNPKQYAENIKEAYGKHRKILMPPSGDNVRKFVTIQSQRLGRMNQGMRSTEEMSFFSARQVALKALGAIYIELQCQALGLDLQKNKKTLQDKDLKHDLTM